jgi:thiamine-phosphate pyrophosphorylase
LVEACRESQGHVARLLASNPTPLGTHGTPLPVPRGIPLQYITAPAEHMSPAEQAEAVCRGGVRWVQLRVKEGGAEQMLAEARAVQRVCRRHGALFIVNDRVEVARALDADGVHLGKEDMDPVEARRLLGCHKLIGATCNTFEEIVERARQGVDYIGLGPYAFTTTKERLAPLLGLDGYRRVLASCRAAGITLPVYAIGGIRREDIAPLMQTGIAGVALSSLIKNNNDPSATARLILDELCLYK